MNDIIEAMDVDGQLFVSAHNLPEFIERASERGAEQERLRILEIISRRADAHHEFIDSCMDHEIRIASSILGALSELRSLLREI
jgi:hypothetical protein